MRTEARARRKQLAAEAEFYGAMDGASRFTQRDAVASILITGINIIAGFLIGVLQHGMDLRHALETYTVLTIGDGLVTVIPALMISISGGLIVTRTGSEDSLGAEFQKQVLGNSQPLLLAERRSDRAVGVSRTAHHSVPRSGRRIGRGGWRMRRKIRRCDRSFDGRAAKPKENLDALLKMEPLSVEVGLGLVNLVERGTDSPLLQRVAGIRRQLATQLGYLMPPVKVKDNIALRSREYVIQMRGTEIARFELLQGHELAIPSGNPDRTLQGKATHDPAFGLPAIWIRQDQTDLARSSGYTVVDAVSVIGTHLTELVRRHAHELFSAPGRQDLLRPRGAGQSESGRGFGAKTASTGDSPTSHSKYASGTCANSRRGRHPGSAGRSCAEQQESGAADRICAPVHPPRHRAAADERARRAAGVSAGSVHRAGHRIRRGARRN